MADHVDTSTGHSKEGSSSSLLRGREGHARVTMIELFYDLVFVFAITQLSHSLIAHASPLGLLQTTLLFFAVWWVWIYTSWITNWLDPERWPVRVMLIALMLVGLVMSISIPQAFEARGLTFALAYAGIQVGRTAFMLWAIRGARPGLTRNFQRILIWLAISSILWVAGAFIDGNARLGFWGAALALDLAGPSLGFFVPGMGRSTTSDWDVEGAHLSERCALFIIIALGESLLLTGATFEKLVWDGATIAAFGAAFLGSAVMWWIYFDTGAERGTEKITKAEDPGRIARLAYTYWHLPIVGGIIVSAVADEFVLAHPHGHADTKTILAVLGGPALYLVGNALFKWSISGRFPLSHGVGLGLLTLLVPVASRVEPYLLFWLAALALVVVAIWETRSLRGGWLRGGGGGGAV